MSKQKQNQNEPPFVSVVTPTYGRHVFLPYLITMFQNQTYPQKRMELIILDDSPQAVSDPVLMSLMSNSKNIKYVFHPTKLSIGAKRNKLNDMSQGDIIVAMDDDDFYPPQRVEQAVKALHTKPGYQIAGSSEMHILFTLDMSIRRFGPYGPFHATNGTFAFTKTYAQSHRYDENVAFGEESSFTGNFSEPLKQINPYDTILCIAHRENTFDKTIIKDQGTPLSCKLKMVVKDAKIRSFYESLQQRQLHPH
jgi:glycosyltransferase involved in cell wall biosynthesis